LELFYPPPHRQRALNATEWYSEHHNFFSITVKPKNKNLILVISRRVQYTSILCFLPVPFNDNGTKRAHIFVVTKLSVPVALVVYFATLY